MVFHTTKIKGLYILEADVHLDERGDFAETFSKKDFANQSLVFNVAQINQSLTNKKGTIRGMHFQQEPKAEVKIVQCLRGTIFDVAIDLREGSATYGQWVAEELSQENKKMFFIPKGFAHGFQALTDDCQVQYLMSELYSPEHKSGVRFDDPLFNINWPIKSLIVSEKDQNWPLIEG